MNNHEWELAARRAEKPSAIHFLVCPHSPDSGVLLDDSGEPVLTDYRKVDWKRLAEAARAEMAPNVPKSMGLFIADDAVDVMDVLHLSTATGRRFLDQQAFDLRVRSALSQLTMADMRAGITKIADRTPGVHINTPIQGKRPPLGALVMSLKFTRGSQIIDYLCGATDALFGAPAMVATFEGFKPAPTVGAMPAYLRDWLKSQFGVVYGPNCTVMAIERTFSI